MSSIKLKNKDIYRIKVNDEGEYIEFDLKDIGLRSKGINALNKIEEIQKKYAVIFKEIENMFKRENLMEQ